MEQHDQLSMLLMCVVTCRCRINYWCASFFLSTLPATLHHPRLNFSDCKGFSPPLASKVLEVPLMIQKCSDSIKKRASLHLPSLRRITWAWLGIIYPISEYLELFLFEMDTTKSQHDTAEDPFHHCGRKSTQSDWQERKKENGLVTFVLTHYIENECLHPAKD